MEAKQITIEFDTDETVEKKTELKNALLKKKTGGRKSIKEAELHEVNILPDEVLFQKKYYTIGQVAKMFNENTSLIRFWDNAFEILKPRKNRKGDRYFTPENIKILLLIHDLLRKRKFTIEGAREYIKNEKTASQKLELADSLEKLKLFLIQLKNNL